MKLSFVDSYVFIFCGKDNRFVDNCLLKLIVLFLQFGVYLFNIYAAGLLCDLRHFYDKLVMSTE